MDSGFQVPDSSLCQWNLDSGFVELYSGLQAHQIFPDSGFHKQKFEFPYMGQNNNSLSTDSPLPSVKIGEGDPSPIFTEGREGRGGSVQRLDNKRP